MAPGKTLQVAQALAAAEDAQHSHQQQVPSRKSDPAALPLVRDCPEITDEVEIGCGSVAFGHKEGAIAPTSTHADSTGKRPRDRLLISPGLRGELGFQEQRTALLWILQQLEASPDLRGLILHLLQQGQSD